MKKILMILPCFFALYGCDKINFYEENIKCIKTTLQSEPTTYVYYDSLKVNSKEAALRTADKK